MAKYKTLVLVVCGLIVASLLALVIISNTNKPDTDTVSSQTSYVDYDKALLERANTGRVVLFFNASWCPTCRVAEGNFKKQAELGNFPTDLTIVSVDYDSHEMLRRQYGVTGQHTFVQVDSSGQALKIWVGGYTVDQVIKQLDS